MPRVTRRDALVVAACAAFALLPYLANVRHAGFYVAAAAFAGGLLIGLRAVAVVFVVSTLLAIGLVAEATINPTPGVDDTRSYALVFVTVIPAIFSVPAVAGAAVGRIGRRAS